MSKDKETQFEDLYLETLEAHLKRKSRGRMTSRAARKLGQEAVLLDIDSESLVRIHYRATQALNRCERDETTTSAEGVFLAEALRPIEQMKLAKQRHLQIELKAAERSLQQQSKHYDKLLAASQRQKEQARHLTRQFFLAQEKERKEISRDLHDEIAQVLAGINVRLAALKKIAQLDRQGIGERIDQTQKLVEQSVSAVHRYALRLRPSLLDDLGLVPSLRSYVKNFPGRKGLSIRLKTDSEADCLNNQQRTALYRVAQEALTNVVRHARAKNVNVTLRKFSDEVRLEVRDDGKAFDAKRILNSISHTRLGLLGMRERVEMLGGVFSIESTPELGTSIIAKIPLGPTPSKPVS